MNRPELFVKSVDILVDAYNRGKLRNMSTCHCAVGNLISYREGNYVSDEKRIDWHQIISSMRAKLKYNPYGGNPKGFPKEIPMNITSVQEVVTTISCDGDDDRAIIKNGLAEMRKTEYSLLEIEKIERAFENADQYGNYNHDGQRGEVKDGLIRAIGVLGEIHKIPKKTVKCMQEHVENKTYKFSYKFEKAKKRNACPIVKPLK